MKIERPGTAPPPIAPADSPAAELEATALAPASGSGAAVAGSHVAAPGSAMQGGLAIDGGDESERIAADLEASRITPERAVELLIESALDTQLPADVPAELRAQMSTVLRSLVTEDPSLLAITARLGATPVPGGKSG